jgi:hypothetical protein
MYAGNQDYAAKSSFRGCGLVGWATLTPSLSDEPMKRLEDHQNRQPTSIIKVS